MLGALAALVVLAPAPALGAPADDACDLLRRADIKQVFDARVGRPEEGDLFPDCEWKVKGFGKVRATYDRADPGAAYDAAVSVGAALGDDSVRDTPIQGLGIRALRRDGQLITLFVLSGASFFSVQLEPRPPVDAKGGERKEVDDQVERLAYYAIRRA